MKKALIICAVLLTMLRMPNVIGQNSISVELSKTTRAYLAAKNFSASVRVIGFKSKSDKTGTLIGNGEFKKSGNLYYSKFSTDELISNEKLTLVIDHDEKTISLLESPGEAMSVNWQDENLLMLDSMIRQNDSVVLSGIVSGVKCYSFYSKGSDIVRTDVHIDASSYFVKKIVYWYRSDTDDESFDMDKVEIVYSNISTDLLPAIAFSERKYVIFKGKQAVLTQAFANYKLSIIKKDR